MSFRGFKLNVNIDRCVGCEACTVSCQMANGSPPGYYRNTIVQDGPHGKFPHLSLNFYRRACMHCADPACMRVCPMGVYTRSEEGYILIDSQRCIRCKKCTSVCSYKAISFNPRIDAMDKCDLCAQRLAQGEEPACVATCLNDALTWQLEAVNTDTVETGLPFIYYGGDRQVCIIKKDGS